MTRGSYDQPQALLDTFDTDAVSGHERRVVRGVGAPELAVHEDEPVASDDALVADEPLHADRRGSARHADHARQRDPQQQSEARGDPDRDRQGDLVRLSRGVEQDEGAEDEHDPSGNGERSVRRYEGLGHEERRREHHQEQSRD